MTFVEAVAQVRAARTPDDLFAGPEPARAYRRLVRLLHPDRAPAGQGAVATEACARLSTLWAERGGPGTVLTTRRRRYTVGAQVATGDIADLYELRHDKGEALLKVPRGVTDNDLMDREAEALAKLARDGDPKYRAYVPSLVETFVQEQPATGARRSATILDHCRGFVSLAEVARRLPGGVDPRDVAWMWRRLLVALGYAHRAGVVHGAVLPEHVLIHPDEHGLVLVDWCYSVVRSGDHVPAIVARHRDHYPPEVAAREPATPATDIHLASGTMRRLMGARAHPALRRFADGCMQSLPRMRPPDAWRLLAELDDLLTDLFGPRRFRPFTLPTAPA
nr:molecular chaperone DnaJ [Micromonospora sp. DSM 115978]